MAINKGIDLTKKIVASSIDESMKYTASPTAKNIAVSRGKSPVIISPKRTISAK